MPDTQIPVTNKFDLSENFDFGTITNQHDEGVFEVDLSDAQINLAITDYTNSTYKGRGRTYMNGKIKKDPDDGFYYLSGDASKSGFLTFTQSKDSIDAGETLSMHLSGETRSVGNNYAGYLANGQLIKPGVRRYVDGRGGSNNAFLPGDDGLRDITRPASAADEASSIVDSYTLHGHNSYAYMPHLHQDYSPLPEYRFDFGNDGGVTPLTAGTGVYTTRMMDFTTVNYGAGSWNNSTNGMNQINGFSTNKRYESDGVTVDTMATYFAQQTSQLSKALMKGEHTAMNMAVKLGSDLQLGEYTPFCFIDRVDGARNIMAGYGYKDTSDAWKTIRNTLAETTGTDFNDDDYWKHYPQYFTLTTNHFNLGKRQVKDMVIYIGKPAGGNSLGGAYEIVYFSSGADIYYTMRKSRKLSWPGNSLQNGISTFQKLIRVPIDDGSGSFDPSTWNPFFLHTVASHRHLDFYGVTTRKGYVCGSENNNWYRSTGGQMVSAFGPGILDFSPGMLNRSDLVVDTARSKTKHSGTYSHRSGLAACRKHAIHNHNFGGWGADDSCFYYTFLTTPGKIEGIANINIERYRDNWQVPTAAGDEDNKRNITYFPQKTVSYEAIGAGSEIVDNSSEAWEQTDMLIDGSLDTQSAVFGLGEENAVEFKVKPAPNRIADQLDADSVVKEIVIEIRKVAKKYMNPAIRLSYSLWNYENELVPYQVSTQTNVTPDPNGTKDSMMIVVSNLGGANLSYNDLINCRLRIWVDG